MIKERGACPPYPLQYSGACIVAGNAACLFDDLQKTGDHPIIAVNGAAKHVEAFALVSQHPSRIPTWRQSNQEAHSVEASPYVDYWWDLKRSGGSAWLARKIAHYMGFEKVILCGCPLEPGPYVGNHNIGGFMHKPDVVDTLFQQIEQDTDWHENVISMSGRTKELFC